MGLRHDEKACRQQDRIRALLKHDQRPPKKKEPPKVRSEAERTRVRQGWALIALSCANILLVWVTRH